MVDKATLGSSILFFLVLIWLVWAIARQMSRSARLRESARRAERTLDQQVMDERERIFVLLRERKMIEDALPDYYRPDLKYAERVVTALEEWRERCL